MDENICYICRSGVSENNRISPCKCKGSMEYIHLKCFAQILQNDKTCSICKTMYILPEMDYEGMIYYINLLIFHMRACYLIGINQLIWWSALFYCTISMSDVNFVHLILLSPTLLLECIGPGYEFVYPKNKGELRYNNVLIHELKFMFFRIIETTVFIIFNFMLTYMLLKFLNPHESTKFHPLMIISLFNILAYYTVKIVLLLKNFVVYQCCDDFSHIKKTRKTRNFSESRMLFDEIVYRNDYLYFIESHIYD